MENSFENIDELISKVLAGEANANETEWLKNWRAQAPQNEEHYAASEKLFNAINSARPEHDFNIDTAWSKLNHRIEENETKVIPLRKPFSVVRVAAALLLIATLAFLVRLVFTSEPVNNPVMYAARKPQEKMLPDGSRVFMNKNAELSYEVKQGKRQVKLKGEAYFDVKHNEAEPFVIEVNNVLIKDIGTAFNVKALPESKTIEVMVESGEVQFFTENNKGLNLIAGQKAIYDKNTQTFSMLTVSTKDNTMSYRSKIFHFDNVALKDMLAEINGVYDSNIQLADEKAGNCHISVDFNNEDLDVLVSIIAETLELEVEQKNGAILLKGTACSQ